MYMHIPIDYRHLTINSRVYVLYLQSSMDIVVLRLQSDDEELLLGDGAGDTSKCGVLVAASRDDAAVKTMGIHWDNPIITMGISHDNG